MGWTFNTTQSSKNDFIRNLTKDKNWDDGKTPHWLICLTKSLHGNRLWVVWYDKFTFKKHLVLYLLSSQDKCWGYKDISEEMGPCYYDCPKKLIKLLDSPRNEYASEWRKQVLMGGK